MSTEERKSFRDTGTEIYEKVKGINKQVTGLIAYCTGVNEANDKLRKLVDDEQKAHNKLVDELRQEISNHEQEIRTEHDLEQDFDDLKESYLTLARESLEFFGTIKEQVPALQHLVHDIKQKVHELESR